MSFVLILLAAISGRILVALHSSAPYLCPDDVEGLLQIQIPGVHAAMQYSAGAAETADAVLDIHLALVKLHEALDESHGSKAIWPSRLFTKDLRILRSHLLAVSSRSYSLKNSTAVHGEILFHEISRYRNDVLSSHLPPSLGRRQPAVLFNSFLRSLESYQQDVERLVTDTEAMGDVLVRLKPLARVLHGLYLSTAGIYAQRHLTESDALSRLWHLVTEGKGAANWRGLDGQVISSWPEVIRNCSELQIDALRTFGTHLHHLRYFIRNARDKSRERSCYPSPGIGNSIVKSSKLNDLIRATYHWEQWFAQGSDPLGIVRQSALLVDQDEIEDDLSNVMNRTEQSGDLNNH